MRTRWIAAAVMAIVGLIWMGQGLGIIRGSSFMVGDGRWTIAGSGMVVAGVVVAWKAVRNRRRA
jgi:predicted Co/Zn/Cd cation transporter (cation efflux family)